MPTTSSAITMFEPVTSRERNRRSGISGLSIRAWRTTNATSRTAAMPASVSVRVEVQPYSMTPRIV